MAIAEAEAEQRLNDRESEWRDLLSGVSLVAEVDIEPQEVEDVLLALGSRYSRLCDPYLRLKKDDKRRLLRRWPACIAVGMSWAAATGYEEGTYWRKLWGMTGYTVPQGDQSLWGEAFISALDRLGLPAFPEVRGHRFLGQILIHSGIPTSCLKDLLDMLVEHARRDPGLDAASYIRWATSGSNRMNHLDKPVRHLIEEGGEYAYHLIDRLLELLDRLRDPRPDLWGIGLPDRLVDQAQLLAERKQIGLPSGARRSSQSRFVSRPRLALDPFGEGPRILLPGARNTWRVTVDGHPHDIRATPAWPGQEMAETSFPLSSPVGHVQIRVVNSADVTEIGVVRADDPLLVFTEDGELIEHGRPLPSAPVWLLYPEDRKLDGDVRVISDAYLPFGWQDWSLQEVDLEGASRLALDGGTARDVSSVTGPRLLLPAEPVPGVTAAHQQPVYNVAPTISLPGDKARTWFVTLRQIDGKRKDLVRMKARSGRIDPWDKLSRPVAGTFDVSILGPLGFRFYRRFAVAEGLTVSYQPALRLLSEAGLEPVEATLSGTATLNETSLAFNGEQRERSITYGVTDLVVTPPHVSVLHDSARGGARWRSSPLRLTTEDLIQRDPGWLLVRAPGLDRMPPLLVTGTGISQDVRQYGAHHPGQARYRLNRITDTVEATRRLDIGVQIRGHVMPVASVRPRQLATGAVRVGKNLRLTGCSAQPGLHAGIYAVYEPWREAEILPVRAKGIVVLPSSLQSIGPLRVLPAILGADASWPHWPSADDSFLVPAELSGHDNAPAILFVSGKEPCPEDFEHQRMWELVSLAGYLETDGAREDLHTQGEMRLRSYPVDALLALAGTRLNPADAVAQVIRMGLAEQHLTGRVPLAAVRLMWGRLHAVAALLSGGILADPGQMAELIDLVREDHGTGLAELLLGEFDPYRDQGHSERVVPVQADRAMNDAIGVLNATPYRELGGRIDARPNGVATVSAALALAMRAAAHAGIRRDFRRKHRPLWEDLARSDPDLVSLDIIAAQAAISAIDRRSRMREHCG